MKPLTAKEVEAILRAHGWSLSRTTGSHFIYRNENDGRSIPIPKHGNKVLKQGTLIGIFKGAGIPRPPR